VEEEGREGGGMGRSAWEREGGDGWSSVSL